jgi:CheY-like chemotaxis protein
MPFHCGKRSAGICVVFGPKNSSTHSHPIRLRFFLSLQPCICQHLLSLATKDSSDRLLAHNCLDLSPIDLIHVNPLLSGHGEGKRVSAISVVVADQQRRLRSSYVRQLRPETGIAVIGEAATSYEVVKALKLKPNVLLLDCDISALHGVSILPLVRHQSPGTRVILLGERTSRSRLLNALSLGARGYLRRTVAKTFLPKAVRVVGEGDVWIPRTIVSTILAAVGQIRPN